jgi:mono/diheme cytochrome c family protein
MLRWIMKTSILSVALLSLSSLLVGCNGSKNQTNVELIQGMMDQISVKAQDWDPQLDGKSGMRLPPEGTIPRNKKYYKYTDPIQAERGLKNPLRGESGPEVITLGKMRYDIACAVCHGAAGDGTGPVAAKMPVKPPSLLSEKVRDFKDGRIFHIITKGQGLMGNYANQIINERDRWAVVNYIRNLQKNAK